MQQIYLLQVSHDTFVVSHSDLYTIAADFYQISLFPNISIAQATTPDLDAAIQSPYFNFYQDIAFPAKTDSGAYLSVQTISTGLSSHMTQILIMQQQTAAFIIDRTQINNNAISQQSRIKKHDLEEKQEKEYI